MLAICRLNVVHMLINISPKSGLNVEMLKRFHVVVRKTLVCTPRAGTKRELLGQNSMQNRLTKHTTQD